MMGILEFANAPTAQQVRSSGTNGARGQNGEARKKAEFWLNIGYETGVEPSINDDGVETDYSFATLSMGIPLDVMDLLPENSRNSVYAMFQASRNALAQQLLEAAQTLKPGESRIIGTTENGLALQIRRVGEARAPVNNEENPFVRKLSL